MSSGKKPALVKTMLLPGLRAGNSGGQSCLPIYSTVNFDVILKFPKLMYTKCIGHCMIFFMPPD